jgi:hypothetical protein
MPSYMFLHSLLNVLVQIKWDYKKNQLRKIVCIDSQDTLAP